MKNNKTKLIGVDLDGTFLTTGSNHNQQYHPDNIEAFKGLIDNNHIPFIITGRSLRDSEEVYKKLNLSTPIVNMGGSVIHMPGDNSFKKIIKPMDEKKLNIILNDEIIKDLTLNFYIEYDEDIVHVYNYDYKTFWDRYTILEKTTHSIYNKTNLRKDPLFCLVEIDTKKHGYKKTIEILEKRISSREGFETRLWEDENEEWLELEIISSTSGKANALKSLCKIYDIDIKDTYVFGDSDNDLSMIQAAGTGIAMKNGIQSIKDIADDITEYTNDEGGVGKYIFDKILNEKDVTE